MPKTLLESILEHAKRSPGKTALAAEDTTVTYEALAARIAGGADLLRRNGVVTGDRVLLCGPNVVETAVAYFSIHAAGAVAVPVDADASIATLQRAARACSPRLSVGESSLDIIGLPRVALEELRAGSPSAVPFESPRLDDVADILFTTGTTMSPKGVVLTHANIAHAALNITGFLQQDSSDIEVLPIPLSHSFGLGRLRSMAHAGSTLVLVRGLSKPLHIIEAVTRHKATALALVPAGFAVLRRLTKSLLGQAKDHVRWVEIGSAAMPDDLRDWLLELLPSTRICHHYGLTEASRAAFIDHRAHREDRAHRAPGAARGCIGKASPNVTITIRDDDGKPRPAGAAGEIWIEGGMVMREYLNDPELTREALVGGALRTGDLGIMDDQGNVYLQGRRRDLINVGGYKVLPAEVEELVAAWPEVRDAACSAVPDAISGERVKLFIVAERDFTLEEVRTRLQAATLETYKIPVAVERVEAIPRTVSGKILRRELVEASKRG